MTLQSSLIALAALAACGTAGGASVHIVNAGFESDYPNPGDTVPSGGFPVGPPPAGWSLWEVNNAVSAGPGNVGVLNPGVITDDPGFTFFPSGAPEGNNVALMYTNGGQGGDHYGIQQTLGQTLQPNAIYTLTVQVGNIASGQSPDPFYGGFGFFTIEGFPGYQVQLLADDGSPDGFLLAQDDNTLAPFLGEGVFGLSTVQLTTDPVLSALEDAPLIIRLLSLNQAGPLGNTGVEVDFDDVQLDVSVVPLPLSALLMASALGVLGVVRWRGRARANDVLDSAAG